MPNCGLGAIRIGDRTMGRPNRRTKRAPSETAIGLGAIRIGDRTMGRPNRRTKRAPSETASGMGPIRIDDGIMGRQNRRAKRFLTETPSGMGHIQICEDRRRFDSPIDGDSIRLFQRPESLSDRRRFELALRSTHPPKLSPT